MEIEFNRIENIEFEGIDLSDSNDFVDAYIVKCDYKGLEATEEELDEINKDRDFVYEELIKHLN
jgi:hypothetical protein